MKQIESFNVDHTRLIRGVYVSRKDRVGEEVLTTFDIRMARPNFEPVINTAELHTIEHLGATFLRNHKEYGNRIVYFGPMGCRTGLYLILAGDYEAKDIIELLKELFEFIAEFEGEIPGATAASCGNFQDMNLNMAKYLADIFLKEVLQNITVNQLNYPV